MKTARRLFADCWGENSGNEMEKGNGVENSALVSLRFWRENPRFCLALLCFARAPAPPLPTSLELREGCFLLKYLITLREWRERESNGTEFNEYR